MLTPGDAWLAVAGTGQEASRFWQAFFNPALSGPAYPCAACLRLPGGRLGPGHVQPHRRRQGVPELENLAACAGAPGGSMPAFVLLPAALLWYLWHVPEPQRALHATGHLDRRRRAFTRSPARILIIPLSSATIVAVVYSSPGGRPWK